MASVLNGLPSSSRNPMGPPKPRPPTAAPSTTSLGSRVPRPDDRTHLRMGATKAAPVTSAVTVTLDREDDQVGQKRGREDSAVETTERKTLAAEGHAAAVNGHAPGASNGHAPQSKARKTKDSASVSQSVKAKQTKSPKPAVVDPKPAKKRDSAARTAASEAPEEAETEMATEEAAASPTDAGPTEEVPAKRRTYRRKRTDTQIQMDALASVEECFTNKSIKNALSGVKLRRGVVRVIRAVMTKKMVESIAKASAEMWAIKDDSVQRPQRLSTVTLADCCRETFNPQISL